jgi:hypothetical protein
MSTTTPQQWLDLAEWIEKVMSEADREIDVRISELGEYTIAPRYTASLDAITKLIEREFPNSVWTARRNYALGAKAAIDPTLASAIYADAETPALALCAVFCRAMAERD